MGAIGIEMVAAFYGSFNGGAENMTLAQDAVRAQIPNAEEFLEMLGVIVFIYALMSYVRTQVKEVRFRVD